MGTRVVRRSSDTTAPAHLGNTIVPPKSILAEYVQREVIDSKHEFDVFDQAMQNKWNVLIEGPTGPGKTFSVMAYAAREEALFGSVASHVGAEKSALYGRWVPDGEGGFKWNDGVITTLIRQSHHRKCVLLINEVNFLPERVASVLFGLLDRRRSIVLDDKDDEIVEAGDNLLVVADMNPDYEGTRPLNKAFRNRFPVQLFFDYDSKIEAKLVKSKALLTLASQLRGDVAKGTLDTPVSTNMLIEFERIYKSLGMKFAVQNFVNHFSAEDRNAVTMVFKTHETNLIRSYAPPVKTSDKDSAKPVYNPNTPEVYVDEQGRTWNLGDFDSEFGVYGIDWVVEEVEV